jgi:hypothetical protein
MLESRNQLIPLHLNGVSCAGSWWNRTN